MAMSLARGAFNARMAALTGVPFLGYRFASRARRFGAIPALRRVSRSIPVVRRAWKSSRQFRNALAKRKARKRVGDTPTKENSKRAIVAQTGCVPVNSATQYIWDLTEIGGSGDDINKRERGIVRIGGWRIDYEAKNNIEAPIYINMAIISQKACNNSNVNSDFFRSSTSQRGVAFDAALTDLERFYNGINSDKWTILMHKRMRLAGNKDSSPGTTEFYSSAKTSYVTLDKFIKLGRQVRFDQATSTAPVTQVYLVIWYGRHCGSGSTTTAIADHNVKVKCYFRDP